MRGRALEREMKRRKRTVFGPNSECASVFKNSARRRGSTTQLATNANENTVGHYSSHLRENTLRIILPELRVYVYAYKI